MSSHPAMATVPDGWCLREVIGNLLGAARRAFDSASEASKVARFLLKAQSTAPLVLIVRGLVGRRAIVLAPAERGHQLC